MSTSTLRTGLLAALTAAALLAGPAHAQTMDKVRVAKSVTTAFFFAMVDLGAEQGHYKAQNIDIEISAFAGDARMQQALTAQAVDIGFGSGPGMAFAAKGVPAIAIAAIANQPLNMAMVINPKLKSVADLKGQKVGVTTAGSLTDWLARKLSTYNGWGPKGFEVLPIGEARASIAALRRGDIAGFVTATENAINLEQEGIAKIVSTFGDEVADFHTHVIFAQRKLIAENPELLRRFLRAWFTTVKFVKANKAATVKSIANSMKLPEKVIDIAYDKELAMINDDGSFHPKALEVIRHSFLELGSLDRVPELKEILVEGFVPVKM